MKRIVSLVVISLFCIAASTSGSGCGTEPETRGGVKRVQVNVPLNPDGLTIEQRNVRDRLLLDNTPGSLKHLYVISAYSGQVLIYSTVDGKVTSSGKRLEPSSISVSGSEFKYDGVHLTTEVLGDDGTYGSSVEYLYWWDSQGRYHQHYVSGGQIVHISDQPLNVRGVIINMEVASPQTPEDTKDPNAAPR